MAYLTPSVITEKYYTRGFPLINYIAKHHTPNMVTSNWKGVDETDEILYSLNSLGYRDREFKGRENNSIWCSGHSDTVGVGVKESETWPRILCDLSGIDCLNLAVAGAGWDTVTRVLMSGLKVHRPKAIVVIDPPDARREFIGQSNSQLVLPSLPEKNLPYKDFYRCRDYENNNYNRERNQQALINVCSAMSINLYILNFELRNEVKKTDPSVEGTHIGPNTHKLLAKEIYDCLNLKN